MEKPKNIPAEAWWDELSNEWALGSFNEKNQHIGYWQWWYPNGTLICESHFNKEGKLHGWYKRYHPDKTVSRQGTYENGLEHGYTTFCKSKNPTKENFLTGTSSTIWKAILKYKNGNIVEYKYFLEDDTEVDLKGNKTEVNSNENKTKLNQTNFTNPQEASERWNKEGSAYVNGLLNWLKKIESDSWQDLDQAAQKAYLATEPKESRHDMAQYVLDYLQKANDTKDYESSRKLFPPAYEPFVKMYDDLSNAISQVLLLKDLKIIVRVGDYYEKCKVYSLYENKIEEIPDLIAIGACYHKKYYAKAYSDRVDIHEGWDGPQIHSFSYPKNYSHSNLNKHGIKFPETTIEELNIVNIIVFPSGDKLLLVTISGIFELNSNSSVFIYPLQEYQKNKEDTEILKEIVEGNYAMIHAAIHPTGKYIALGWQDSAHYILDENYEQLGVVYPRSEYPHFAVFSKYLAIFNSCHLYKGATIGVDLKLLPGLEADAYEADERLQYLDEVSRVYAAVIHDGTIIVGDANGYLWCRTSYENYVWNCFLGGTIYAMDISPDDRWLVVTTYTGVVHLLDLKAEQKDDHLIGSATIHDQKRYLFWKGYSPLVW